MARDRSLALDYSGQELADLPPQSWTVLRARFDRWFADEAEARGALILPKTSVEKVLVEGGRTVGVVAGGDELRADVVIACDGVLSLTAEQAGLHTPLTSSHYAVGIKEVIALDAQRIEDRFALDGAAGAARLYVGVVTEGLFGGGFLYTNRDSVSLGLVVGLDALGASQALRDVPALLDAFKARPEIAPLLKGGQTAEYAAHLIPEGGLEGLLPFWGEGILVAGDAAGLALNLGVTVRGMEYALASGYYAAQAVMAARKAGDFSASSLAVYGRLLEESFVMKDFRTFREAPRIVANPRFFNTYPELMGDILREIYAVGPGPKERLFPAVRRHLPWSGLWPLLKDLREGAKL
ncbi:MAG: Electron transfer flavoprotein-ubiquinone oxidoreductase [Synergistetes bacterium ADurb.Bin520]|nr:MAG: Electron transfer flavoprotein-ubiquinone oxidoreductase [Synergistetes bacterium ADurb.Bin520]